jgi:transcriptional regulator with XRE-family HTH domain
MILNHLLNNENEGEKIYELRIVARLTQKELAAHLGVDRRIVGRLMTVKLPYTYYCDSSSPALPFIWGLCKLTQSAYDWHLYC